MGLLDLLKKKSSGESSPGAGRKSLPRPKDLPPMVGRELVVTLGKQPDWVWSLKAALREKEGRKNIFEFRVFDPGETARGKVKIVDFNSLDPYPDLILFEGWYDKKTYEVHFTERPKPQPTSKAA